MSRYIDADAAIKRFEELHGNENILLNSYNADWIVSFIEGQPTAHLLPCDVCAYNPPSSGDGKPCSMCPAVKKEEE